MTTKLRISTHRLNIELGRYAKTSVHLRTCNISNSLEIEDKFHVICVCDNMMILEKCCLMILPSLLSTLIHVFTLRNHAYSNILKISPPKTESFQIKILIFFHISAQNIDCGYSLEPPRRGGSNEYPQSMFLSRNKKNNVYPCKPQFYYIKVGFQGVRII